MNPVAGSLPHASGASRRQTPPAGYRLGELDRPLWNFPGVWIRRLTTARRGRPTALHDSRGNLSRSKLRMPWPDGRLSVPKAYLRLSRHARASVSASPQFDYGLARENTAWLISLYRYIHFGSPFNL